MQQDYFQETMSEILTKYIGHPEYPELNQFLSGRIEIDQTRIFGLYFFPVFFASPDSKYKELENEITEKFALQDLDMKDKVRDIGEKNYFIFDCMVRYAILSVLQKANEVRLDIRGLRPDNEKFMPIWILFCQSFDRNKLVPKEVKELINRCGKQLYPKRHEDIKKIGVGYYLFVDACFRVEAFKKLENNIENDTNGIH